MTSLTRETIQRLATSEGEPLLSIYLPTVKAGDQTNQNKIRYKNALRQAAAELEALGLSKRNRESFLKECATLTENHDFWQNQDLGLAVFAGGDSHETIHLPELVPERTMIGQHFHLKPLLPFATGQVRYYVLALEREGIRLFRGARHGAEQVPLTGVPNSLSEHLQWDDPEAQLQWHTQTSRLTVSGRASMFHGHGAGTEGEVETEQLVRFLTALDKALDQVLSQEEQPPLAVIGGEELIGHYRKVRSDANAIVGELEHDPSRLTTQEIHDRSWPLVESHFNEKVEAARQQYLILHDDERRVDDLERVLTAVQAGAVRLLFVPGDVQRWGRISGSDGTIEVHDERQPGDDDLFDRAAVEGLNSGADVYVVPQQDVPGEGSCAAVLRYPVPEIE